MHSPCTRVSRALTDRLQNHMVEDLLACYDCGATPATLRNVYDRVKKVQRVRPAPRVDLRDAAEWRRCIGDNKYYSDFVTFFEAELAVRGWRGVVDVWMFSGSEEADALLARCFSGVFLLACLLVFVLAGV